MTTADDLKARQCQDRRGELSGGCRRLRRKSARLRRKSARWRCHSARRLPCAADAM